jgi:superfamily II DNA or RNA helicase
LRLHSQDDESKWLPLRWDEGEPWRYRLQLKNDGTQFIVRGALWRGEERMDLSAAAVLLSDGVLIVKDVAARFDHGGAFNWVGLLREQNAIAVPIDQGAEFLTEILQQRNLPPLDLPEELRYDEIIAASQPRLVVKLSPHTWEREKLRGELSFDYDERIVARDDPRRALFDGESRRLLLRDVAAEQAAQARLMELGWRTRRDSYGHGMVLELKEKHLPRCVRELIAAGWHVEAQGRKYRQPGEFEFKVGSGVDWFDLQGSLQFETTSASLPRLLEAVRRGDGVIKLDDGSFGLLPEEWLKKYGALAGLGVAEGDSLRFKRNQVGFLDALLAAQPQVSVDAAFTQARQTLQSFSGVQALDPPKGFKGELRPYQRDGLGWLQFLRTFGFGGCLADDMGLGKTVQVLAMLEARRQLRVKDKRIGPSLAVVPKSLVFNWQQEAARFAPQLRVLDHTGATRVKGTQHFIEYDLLLTTYGTLRNDAEDFKDVRFDYVILDEAQAIKNAKSESAKAARLLQADHRLALSGTPIENHLGELWSLVEFLNPGMLGAASIFQNATGATRTIDEDTRSMLSQALRPFFLRRTKTQVLKDLPPKVEQTLYCELDVKQRKLYDELRHHYRNTLLERVDKLGIGRAKIQILEALLRLRQAAIHPGLIDSKRVRESSAKLDLLLPQLQEAIDEGHKTLVFSQFTGMLAILRDRLDRDGVTYEYLDGKTRDREARVTRFQTDPGCKLFLISLKAGGTGLNLTAAQYVFLLDPWWNPAVEAQAIDRAHRIGQPERVFAYRLIARDTIEEKVLQLQNSKRELADAILGAGDSVLRALGKEDLEMLLA